MKLEGLKINFLGDSITEGCGTSGEPATFWAQMKKDYHLAEARGYGIGGARIARQQNPTADRYDHAEYCTRYKTMDPDADVVVVFGGTNDFGHGDAIIGEFSDRTPDTFYGACHLLFSGLMEMYPESTIVIMTPLHRSNEDNPRGDDNDRKPRTIEYGVLSKYVGIIKEVAEYYSLAILDLWSMSGLTPKVQVIKEKYMPDGLHPNDAGHKVLEARIAGFLQSL